MTVSDATGALRRTVLIVALLNLGAGAVEVVVSAFIGSVSLLADAADFAEDGAINLLVFWAVVWTARRRAMVGHALAIIVLMPAVVALVTAVLKAFDPTRPDTAPLTLTAAGALAVNAVCALLLVRHKRSENSLARAAWLAARNDAAANVAIMGAGLVALVWVSGWPDIMVGLGLVVLNADAAVKVWRLASRERLGTGAAEA